MNAIFSTTTNNYKIIPKIWWVRDEITSSSSREKDFIRAYSLFRVHVERLGDLSYPGSEMEVERIVLMARALGALKKEIIDSNYSSIAKHSK